MKKLFLLLICLVAIDVLSIVKIPAAQGQTNDCKCVSDALADIEKIKIGDTRENVMKMFRYDGGLSDVKTFRLVYLKCDSIKVDVTFGFVNKSENFKSDPKDKIVAISKPYLEHSFID